MDTLHGATDFSVDENFVENDLEQIPLAGTAELEPGDLLGTSPCPLLRVLVESLLYDDDNASASNPGAPDNSCTFVPGPVTPHTAGLSPTPACADPFVHHVEEQPPVGGPDAAQFTLADLEPPPSLLDRLNSDQDDGFLQVWHKLPKHLREISFDFRGPGWDPDVITQLGDTLIEFADSFPRHLPTLVRAPSCRSKFRSHPTAPR